MIDVMNHYSPRIAFSVRGLCDCVQIEYIIY